MNRTFIVTEPEEWCFSIPEEFEMVHQQTDNRRSYYELEVTHGDISAALITVQFLSRHRDFDATQQLRAESKKIELRGYRLRGAAIWPIKPIQNFDRGFAYNPTAEFESQEFDAPVVLFDSSSIVVVVSLLGPSALENIEWNRFNRWAFESLCQSIAPPERERTDAPSKGMARNDIGTKTSN